MFSKLDAANTNPIFEEVPRDRKINQLDVARAEHNQRIIRLEEKMENPFLLISSWSSKPLFMGLSASSCSASAGRY